MATTVIFDTARAKLFAHAFSVPPIAQREEAEHKKRSTARKEWRRANMSQVTGSAVTAPMGQSRFKLRGSH